jgi:hypothetical protein
MLPLDLREEEVEKKVDEKRLTCSSGQNLKESESIVGMGQ